MGHTAKILSVRCDVIDELEAAITQKRLVRVYFEDGSHRSGRPKDLYTENHEDFLQIENHRPIPLSMIIRVEKI